MCTILAQSSRTSLSSSSQHIPYACSPYEMASEFALSPAVGSRQYPMRCFILFLRRTSWINTYSDDIIHAQDVYLAPSINSARQMPKNTPRSIIAALKAVSFDRGAIFQRPGDHRLVRP